MASTLLYMLVGLINVVPIMGVTGEAQLETMYGVEIAARDTLLLMQHRAVLLAIIGGFLVWASFKPSLRTGAATLAFISMNSFVLLVWSADGASEQISSVRTIDIAAILLLVAAIVLDRNTVSSPQADP